MSSRTQQTGVWWEGRRAEQDKVKEEVRSYSGRVWVGHKEEWI